MSTHYTPLERGVWGILSTPFQGPEQSVDHPSLQRLVRHYRAIGAAGVVALGVLGEAARLSTAERQAVLRSVIEAADGMPVVAGLSALATAPAAEEAMMLSALGARAVMVLVSTAQADRLATHLRRIAEAAGCGIVVQDHPLSTGVQIAAADLARAVAEAGVAVAIKAEAPPTAPTVSALSRLVEVPIFGGLGGVGLLDELAMGSAGAMTGFAVPEALVSTVTAWQSGGFEAARRALLPWYPLVLFEAQEKVGLAVRKEILRRRGLLETALVRFPGIDLTPTLADLLSTHLAAAPFVESGLESPLALAGSRAM